MENIIKERFWNILPIKMKAAGIKSIDLANAIGLSKSTISCWIHRKAFPEMDNIQKIANVLNCTTDELLGRELPDTDVDVDKLLVAAYHAANDGTKASVRKLLDNKGTF